MLQKTPQTEIAPEAASAPEAGISAILQSARPARRVGRYVAAGIAALTVLAGLWAWYGTTGTAAVTYTTAAVTRGDLTVTVTATGTVQPTNTIEVSSELSGTVDTVNADYNATVAAGEVLATLKTDKLQANVTLARATVTAREAEVVQADVTEATAATALDRAERLLARGVVTEEAFETAQATHDRAVAALAVAGANLETARANLAIAENELTKAEIVSPVDGIVLARDVAAGQTVAASLQAPVLFTLAEDLTRMQLEVNIDEADIASVSEGDTATFSVESYQGRTFPATIAQVRYSPATVEGVVTYKAILSVDNADLSLRPGMTAIADILVEEVPDTLLVPNAALRWSPPAAATSSGNGAGLLGLLMPRRPQTQSTAAVASVDGRRTIWVLRDGAPVAASVVTGASDGSYTAVVGGDLADGDQVIVGSRTAS